MSTERLIDKFATSRSNDSWCPQWRFVTKLDKVGDSG